MIVWFCWFSVPKGEEILHIQSVLCRKYLYESRFISLQMRWNRHFGAVFYPKSRSKELFHVPISIWYDGQQKAFFNADECMNFWTQTFATEVANVCVRKFIHSSAWGNAFCWPSFQVAMGTWESTLERDLGYKTAPKCLFQRIWSEIKRLS